MTNQDLWDLANSGALQLIDSTVFPIEKIDNAIENIQIIRDDIKLIEEANKKIFSQFVIDNVPPLPNTPAHNTFVEAINKYMSNSRDVKWSRFINEDDIKKSGKLTPIMLRSIRACELVETK